MLKKDVPSFKGQCCLFSYPTVAEAVEHMQFDTIEVLKDVSADGTVAKYPEDYQYGSGANEYLALVQCKNCSALFCQYKREKVYSVQDGVCFLTTYYPVTCRDEAVSFDLKTPKKVWIECMRYFAGTFWEWSEPDSRYIKINNKKYSRDSFEDPGSICMREKSEEKCDELQKALPYNDKWAITPRGVRKHLDIEIIYDGRDGIAIETSRKESFRFYTVSYQYMKGYFNPWIFETLLCSYMKKNRKIVKSFNTDDIGKKLKSYQSWKMTGIFGNANFDISISEQPIGNYKDNHQNVDITFHSDDTSLFKSFVEFIFHFLTNVDKARVKNRISKKLSPVRMEERIDCGKGYDAWYDDIVIKLYNVYNELIVEQKGTGRANRAMTGGKAEFNLSKMWKSLLNSKTWITHDNPKGYLTIRERETKQTPQPFTKPADTSNNPDKHGNSCCLFSYASAKEAMSSMPGLPFEEVEHFGGEGEGYSWSDGSKKLCKCKNCGALFVHYRIKFLEMAYDSGTIRYDYYFPVANREEALKFIGEYIGAYGVSDSYIGKKIWFNPKQLSWCWDK